MKLVFDIGANIGKTVEQFTLVSDKVVCFEPNPKLAHELRSKFENFSVVVDDRGVSNKIGTQIFRISNADTISTLSEDWITNSRFTGSYNWDTHVQVETVTLDSIIEEYGEPDYIKIDVEGHEFEVLTYFTKLLPNTLLSFEWAEEQKSKIESTIHYLNKLGYNMFGYTESDKILFDNEVDWKEYKNFDLIESLTPERKEKWGMIYVKK
jgi:FkbM family methyltransferase